MYYYSDDHLLDFELDLKPLKREEDKQKVDQRIRLRLLPVQVVYDAVSVYVYAYFYFSVWCMALDDLYLLVAIFCRIQWTRSLTFSFYQRTSNSKSRPLLKHSMISIMYRYASSKFIIYVVRNFCL